MNRLSESNSDSDNGDVGEYHHSDEEGGIRLGDIYIPPPPKPICSVENTGPRLIITNITNLNFKSYAGECDLGPFHKADHTLLLSANTGIPPPLILTKDKSCFNLETPDYLATHLSHVINILVWCFTAIIGPNGSGKSNIIDSMLFVFGYRASKIRSKKISVLIHNSTKYSNINSCTVQVHFQQIIDKDPCGILVDGLGQEIELRVFKWTEDTYCCRHYKFLVGWEINNSASMHSGMAPKVYQVTKSLWINLQEAVRQTVAVLKKVGGPLRLKQADDWPNTKVIPPRGVPDFDMAEQIVSKGYEKIFKPVFDKNIWKQAKPKLEDLKEGRYHASGTLLDKNVSIRRVNHSRSPSNTARDSPEQSYQLTEVQRVDDEDSYDVVPNSQFVISRTAFKDNSSYYTIDKKRVQFKEVAKLLRSHGIDLDHNRFLILQGEVEQIAMMKPKGATEHETGMLEFLEDIIGTSRFKEPLQKIIQLGNDLNQERSEKLNRVKMVEKEKDALEEPKNEALKYLKLKNEYTQMLNIDYQLGIHETEQKILEKETSRKSLDDSMAEMKADLRRIAQEKNEIQKADNELKKIIAAESLQKEEMNAKFDEKTSLDTNLQEETQMIARKRKKTKEMLAEEKKKLLELEKVPEKNESEIRELSRNEEKLSNQREVEEAALKQTMDGLKAETQELQDQKTGLQTRLIELNVTKNATKQQARGHSVSFGDMRVKMPVQGLPYEPREPRVGPPSSQTDHWFDIISSELDIYIQNEQKEKTKMEQIQNNLDNTVRRLAECRE
uniref:RecF/RecN/SMC N-terminal domain-containing protein n=1 Tax=Timema douglasi TaxID=61478 RepID=A0A7R8VGS9_TIMDO|nr:unnamed protein product [Timema douglasi]